MGMRGAFALGVAIASLGLTAAASAAVTNIYTLNQDGCSSKCSPNSQDNVSVVDDGSGTLDVTLTLFGGDSIHNNPDANHHALVFDLAAAPAITISGLPSPIHGERRPKRRILQGPVIRLLRIRHQLAKGERSQADDYDLFVRHDRRRRRTHAERHHRQQRRHLFRNRHHRRERQHGQRRREQLHRHGRSSRAVGPGRCWCMGFAGLGFAGYRKTKNERTAFAA